MHLGEIGDSSLFEFLHAKRGHGIANFNNPEMLAQVTLARMGDDAALDEIDREIASENFILRSDSIEKLKVINTPRAIRMLASLLYTPEGVWAIDDALSPLPSSQAAGILERLITENTPPELGFHYGSVEKWRNWWGVNKGRFERDIEPSPVPGTPGLFDPRVYFIVADVCRSPERTLELIGVGDRGVIPYLRKRAQRSSLDGGEERFTRGALAGLEDEHTIGQLLSELAGEDCSARRKSIDALKQSSTVKTLNAMRGAFDRSVVCEQNCDECVAARTELGDAIAHFRAVQGFRDVGAGK